VSLHAHAARFDSAAILDLALDEFTEILGRRAIVGTTGTGLFQGLAYRRVFIACTIAPLSLSNGRGAFLAGGSRSRYRNRAVVPCSAAVGRFGSTGELPWS